jgi:pyruvate dehydrogenase complex dehydrogenase (E1) component
MRQVDRAHQKKLDGDALKLFRDRFELPLTDKDLRSFASTNQLQGNYLSERRTALGVTSLNFNIE